MTSSLLGSVPRSQAGVASGTLNAIRQAGGAIGVALFGALPIHPAFLLGSGLMVAASAAAACLIRSAQPVSERDALVPRLGHCPNDTAKSRCREPRTVPERRVDAMCPATE